MGASPDADSRRETEDPEPRSRAGDLRARFFDTFVGKCVERIVELQPFDRALAIASRAFIAIFPLAIVATSLSPTARSGGFAEGIIDRFGLEDQGAALVRQLFASPTQVRSSTTFLGIIVLVYSVFSFARLLARMYEAAWHLPKSGVRGAMRGLVWVAGLAAYAMFLLPLRNGVVNHTGRVLGDIVVLATAIAIWLFSPWVLLAGRIPWRSLVPTAIATTVTLGGVSVWSGLLHARRHHDRGRALRTGRCSVLARVVVDRRRARPAGRRRHRCGGRRALGATARLGEARADASRARHGRGPVSFGDRILKAVDRINFWRALRLVLVVDGLLVLAAAFLVRIVEPKTFGSMGRALWWAVVTVGTVGYGDIVPESPIGRLVASITILFSLAFIPTVTSLVVSALVRRQQEHQTRDDPCGAHRDVRTAGGDRGRAQAALTQCAVARARPSSRSFSIENSASVSLPRSCSSASSDSCSAVDDGP